MRSITSDARASTAPWRFVSYHEPSLTFYGHNSHWKRREALPAFARAGVDFVITGHSHLYERFKPIVPPQANGSYVTYITSGGGGASTHRVKPTVFHAGSKAVRHVCVFRIRNHSLTMNAIDEDGQVIDHFQVTKNDGRLDSRYLQTAIPMSSLLTH